MEQPNNKTEEEIALERDIEELSESNRRARETMEKALFALSAREGANTKRSASTSARPFARTLARTAPNMRTMPGPRVNKNEEKRASSKTYASAYSSEKRRVTEEIPKLPNKDAVWYDASMGILDSFRKSKEQGQERGTPPPRGHTLAEILQDKSNSHLFGRMLEKDGHELLAQRVVEGKLEPDDIRLLEEVRLKFSEKITQSEKIEKLLTEENVIEIARTYPDFEKIINIVGPKKAIKAIRSQLKEICIMDEYRFGLIADPIEAYDSYKNGEYKETNDSVEKKCKDMGISQRDYLAALAIEDPAEKEKELKKLARGGREGWDRVWNIISRKGANNLRELKDSETLMESSVAELDGYKGDIGSVLFYSVSGNDDMRNALSSELINETTPAVGPEKGFNDAKKETSTSFNQGEFDSAWNAYKTKMSFDTSNDSEKDWLRDNFIDDQKDAYRERNAKNKGFWHFVFATMFEGKINSKKDTLK